MIKELITDELIDKINEKLQVEREKIDKEWKGKIIEYDDLEDTMICDIFLDYYQIPLIEIDDIIDTRLPFLSELGIDISPYVEDLDKCICQPKIRSKDHLILGHFLVNKCASEFVQRHKCFKLLKI